MRPSCLVWIRPQTHAPVASTSSEQAFAFAGTGKQGDMSELQPEVDGRHDSIVVEGDDADHVLPPGELDPYTPEPSTATRTAWALWIALVVLLAVVVVVVYAATR
jgi:hypothetical protein